MPTKKKVYATTIEVDNITRDDITKLAKLEGRKSGMGSISRKQYVTMLIAREKARAVENGDL